MPAFAGCSFQDWYNQNGTVRIELHVPTGEGTRIDEFRSLRVAVYGISLRQLQAQPQHFAFEPDPLVVDLVQTAKEGDRVPMAQFKTNLLATERVAVRMVTLEAITSTGENLEICNLETTVERFPCFYQPDNSALVYEDRPFSPPRGGEVTLGFPVIVAFEQQGRASEYFLQADPTKVIVESRR